MTKRREEDDRNLSENDLQDVARKAAIAVQEEFDRHSTIRNTSREELVPVFDPEEIMLRETLNSGRFCTVAQLRGISIRYDRDEPFDPELDDHRDHFADRSHEEHFVVKAASYKSIRNDEQMAARVSTSIMIETKILANLAKHPHICKLYGTNASGVDTNFGCKQIECGFFIITDMISETLPERMQSWRAKKGYEGDRFDTLESRQSQLTQRLEVVLDICSAMQFLSDRHLVYHLHPRKIGFDSRYKRIKLFDFSQSRETESSMPLHQHHASSMTLETEDMWERVYLAPEVLLDETVTVSSDVYAIGMLIWEILTLRHPFGGMSSDDHMKSVVIGRNKPTFNKTWPEVLRTLMDKCWNEANDRPVMKEVFDGLENSLLFQDLDGIDRTEDHIAKSSTKPRRINHFRGGEETIPEEEHDKDTKSAGSQELKKSNGSEENGKRSKPSSNRRSGTRRSASSPSLKPEHEDNGKDENRSKARGNGESSRTSRSGSGKVPRHKSARHLKDEPTSPDEVNSGTATGKIRKIVYKPDSPVTKEERDRDAKSTKSQKSQRSHEAQASGKSKTSRNDSSRKVTRPKSDPRLGEVGDKKEQSSPRKSQRQIRESKAQEPETDGSGRSRSSQGGSDNSRKVDDSKLSASPGGEKNRRRSSVDPDKRRKIVYKPDQPMADEERDRDAKSTRSHKSQRSHGSNDSRTKATHGETSRRSTTQRSRSSRRLSSSSPDRLRSSREVRRPRSSRRRDRSRDDGRRDSGSRERGSPFMHERESQSRSNSSSDQSKFTNESNSSSDDRNAQIDEVIKPVSPRKSGRAAPASRQINRARSSDGVRLVPSRKLGARSMSVAGFNQPQKDTSGKEPTRGVSRRRSGDIANNAARQSPVVRQSPVTRQSLVARRIGRHKSNDAAVFGNAGVTSAREAPSSRGVSKSRSFEGFSSGLMVVGAGVDNTRGEKPRSEKRSSRSGKAMAGRRSMSTRDFGVEVKQRETIVERMSLSMSDHSKWLEFTGKTGSEQDGHGDSSNDELPTKAGLKPSSKDNQRSTRNRIVKEAKDAKLAEKADAQTKRKEAYTRAVHTATQEGGRSSQKNIHQRRQSHRKQRKSLELNDASAALMKLAAEELESEE